MAKGGRKMFVTRTTFPQKGKLMFTEELTKVSSIKTLKVGNRAVSFNGLGEMIQKDNPKKTG